MGSIDVQFTLCELCRGLFIDADIAANHASTCQGDIAESECDMVACEKHMFLKYILPKITFGPKRKVGRPRKKRPEDENGNQSTQNAEPGSSNAQDTPEGSESKRRYALRERVVAALHTKMANMHKALGVQKKESMERKNPNVEGATGSENTRPAESNNSVEESSRISTTEMAASILQNLKSYSQKSNELTVQMDVAPEKGAVLVIEPIVLDQETGRLDEAQNPTGSGDAAPERANGIITHNTNFESDREANTIRQSASKQGPDYAPPDERGDHSTNARGNTRNKFEILINNGTREPTAELLGNDAVPVINIGTEGQRGSNSNEMLQIKSRVIGNSVVSAAKDLQVQNKVDSGSVTIPTRDADGIYRCKLCDYTSCKKGLFGRHLSSHNDGKMYTCEVCEQKFLYRRFYKQHMGTHYGFPCEYCQRKFGRRHDLQRHIHAVHTRDKWYTCNQCDYKSRHHHLLYDHKRKHTEERFECPVEFCPFKSIYRRALRQHVKNKHSDVKGLICKDCGYRTNDSCAMCRHRKIHIDTVKAFKCTECDYTARNMAYMRAHMQSHSSDKMYKCDQCDFSCVRSSGIRSHMMKHIGVKPWACPTCEYLTTTRNKVQRHINLRHKGEGKPVRQKVSVRFDVKAYRINRDKDNTETDQAGKDGETEQQPKYVLIEMMEDAEPGAALGSNLVGREIVVSGTVESGEIPSCEEETDMSQERETLDEEQDSDSEAGQSYLYKCALCSRVDSDLNVIQEHMSTVHAENETVTAPDSSDSYSPAQAEITIAQLLQAAATSNTDQEEDPTQEPGTDHEAVISGSEVPADVTCIYQTADGTVINPIEVEHIPDHQIVALQDDAVSTAVESILHLQNIPIKEV